MKTIGYKRKYENLTEAVYKLSPPGRLFDETVACSGKAKTGYATRKDDLAMSTNRLQIETILENGECESIDRFAEQHREVEALPQWTEFLNREFGLSLTLDTAIVEGFAADSSNLPGRADALCRPRNERECAIIARACFQAGIPFTVSAGRSNLTGSATPEGGVVVATVGMLSPAVEVGIDRKIVRSPVGVILEDMRKTVSEQSGGKLLFPVDPTSRADAAVGGALACNASGFTPGEAGSMRGWVESIDFLFPNGDKVSARRGQYISEDGIFIIESPSDTRRRGAANPFSRVPLFRKRPYHG